MERILHFTIGPRPAADELAIIEIAKSLHPTWQVLVWQDPVDTDGFLLQDYHQKANSGAQLADLIRLDVIYRYGGIYLDSDVRLVKRLDDLCSLENFFCSEDGYVLTNAVFGAAKGSPVIKALIDSLLNDEPDWSLPPTVTTAVEFFARVLRWRTDINLLPRETFYPYNWNEPIRPPLATTLGVHEWRGSWLPADFKERARGWRSSPETSSANPGLKRRIKEFGKRVLGRAVRAAAPHFDEVRPPAGAVYAFGVDQIARTNRGLYMSLPGMDLSITPEIALTGTYEESEMRFVERTLSGGDFFVDVGCNVGAFSLIAARRVGPFGRVFAFDANDDVLTHLKRSLVMNWVHDRVKVFHCAVGDQEQTVTLKYSTLCLGGANLGLDNNSVFHRSVENLGAMVEKEASMIMLDHVFRQPLEIKIMKVDVEGFEHAVLAGGRRLFENRVIKYLMIELLEEVASERHAKNLNALNFVMKQGYDIARVDYQGNLISCKSLHEATRATRNVVLCRA